MLRCTACGHLNTAQSKFCSQCGTPLATSDGDTTSVIPMITEDTIADLGLAEPANVAELPSHSALLVVRRGVGEGGRFLVNQPETKAGRHPDADIFLDDITVSRHHAMFRITGNEITVEDLGSLNGTYVNRRLVEEPTVLKDRDEVQIGKFRMVVYTGGLR